jgi:hypothetical protein
MKPYQFYVVKHFPKLAQGKSVKNSVQMTFSGEDEDVETTFTMENESFEGSLGLLRVKSGIKHTTLGFIKTVVNQERQRFEFTEYLEPVDFYSYYDAQQKLILFQAPKKVCRGVLANLRATSDDIKLAEMIVDFGKVMEHHSEYLGAWFRGVSSRVRAAGLSGDQIQDDALFKKLSKVGELSNVTIPWMYEGAEHKVMVTSSGAVVLIQEYRNNLGVELGLVMDVHQRLLSKVWQERPKRQADCDVDAEP